MKSFVVAGLLTALLQTPPSAPLRIVVLQGEDAVNVVQQKTAVAPLVEVRDRNDVPVAGATVTFTIASGQPGAFAGGLPTLTVTTNAAGQAAASGFTALGPGAVQIQVQAAYQGQIVSAAISQTNFATAAAAQAGTTGTTGATGGGGISGTTIGVVGAAVAGGAVAATQLTKSEDDSGVTYRGSLTGQMEVTVVNTSERFVGTCITTYSVTGTMEITIREASGTARGDGVRTYVTTGPAPQCPPPPQTTLPFGFEADVTGAPANLRFRKDNNWTGAVPDGGTGTATDTFSFTGAVSSGAISGTLVFDTRGQSTGQTNAQGIPYSGVLSGSASMSITLR